MALSFHGEHIHKTSRVAAPKYKVHVKQFAIGQQSGGVFATVPDSSPVHQLCHNFSFRTKWCSSSRHALLFRQPESERENKYLQGGATPTTRQTLQYLLRNDIIDNIDALTAEVAYLIREREGEGGGDTDERDLQTYLANCKESFDRYLGMVYQHEIDAATDLAKMALASGR